MSTYIGDLSLHNVKKVKQTKWMKIQCKETGDYERKDLVVGFGDAYIEITLYRDKEGKRKVENDIKNKI